jgi:outer membrane protein OmpA-like peptidoglycan-associated protein
MTDTIKNWYKELKQDNKNKVDSNFNKQLSLKRAKAVVNFMIGRGIDSSRLTFEGKGSSSPIDINNRDINRRTEFIIINQ